MFKPIQKEIEMFTNRLFNLLVAVLVVILAIQFTSLAVSPAAGPIDYTAASKYEDRYDRMNHSLGADPSYIAGKYEDRYDRMNHSLGADPSYISGKHEDRYDFMNDFPGTNR
jgi:ABC-type dipeptide/oligopeptide/nickel transport system permease component